MLDTSTVSFIMTDMQTRLISKLEEESFVFPSLIVMDRETIINLQDFMGRYSCVVNVEYINHAYGAYITQVTFRNKNNEDDAAIHQAIKEIAFRHRPDAIGYFAQCLYKPMNRKEYDQLTTDGMNMDPEAIRIFHNCFYIKDGEKEGHLLITPYLLKDQDKEKEEFSFDDSNRFVVTTFDKAWETPTASLKARIENPYL
jgi:hypothetical protein